MRHPSEAVPHDTHILLEIGHSDTMKLHFIKMDDGAHCLVVVGQDLVRLLQNHHGMLPTNYWS